jgi:hypothetical protein
LHHTVVGEDVAATTTGIVEKIPALVEHSDNATFKSTCGETIRQLTQEQLYREKRGREESRSVIPAALVRKVTVSAGSLVEQPR